MAIDEHFEWAKVSVVVGVVLMLSVLLALILGLIWTAIPAATATQTSVNPTTGEWERVSYGDVPNQYQVNGTTGRAVSFDGDDDHVNATLPSVAGSPWTACAVVELADDANSAAAYHVLSVDDGSILIQYDGGDWVAYYDNGSHDALARVPAPSPKSRTPVCGRWNGSSLTVYRSTTEGTPDQLSTAPESRHVANSMHGVVDEVRTFNNSISESSIATYAGNPIHPLPGEQRSARIMFDDGSGDATVYFAAGTASLEGASWTSRGVPDASYSEGTDYDISGNPFEVKVLAGGKLDGAPVIYVTFNNNAFAGIMSSVRSIAAAGLVLLTMFVLVVPIAALAAYVYFSDAGETLNVYR